MVSVSVNDHICYFSHNFVALVYILCGSAISSITNAAGKPLFMSKICFSILLQTCTKAIFCSSDKRVVRVERLLLATMHCTLSVPSSVQSDGA